MSRTQFYEYTRRFQGLGFEGLRDLPPIQSLLSRHEMGNRYDRRLKLEARHSEQALESSPEQVQFLEQHNPAFRTLQEVFFEITFRRTFCNRSRTSRLTWRLGYTTPAVHVPIPAIGDPMRRSNPSCKVVQLFPL